MSFVCTIFDRFSSLHFRLKKWTTQNKRLRSHVMNSKDSNRALVETSSWNITEMENYAREYGMHNGPSLFHCVLMKCSKLKVKKKIGKKK